MKWFIGVLGAVVVVMCGQPRLPASDQGAVPDYYPLKVGTKWHYQVNSNGRTGTIINQIAKVETIDGQALSRLETVAQGNVVATEHLASGPKGVFRHRINGLEMVPALCLLRYPVKEGDTWDAEVKVGDQKLKVTCHVNIEDVTVPAGKYAKAVKLKVETEQAGQKFVSIYWLAAGVGVVKQEADLAGTKVALDLAKYEAGK